MELPNVTLSPLPPLPPPGPLPWDGQLLVACAVLGLPANAFTLWLTGWRLRCRGLATFIFSLAASDLLFLTNSLLQIWSVAQGDQWTLGTPLCCLHQFLYGLGYYSGLFLLAAISLDRCLLVAAPLWYRCRRPARLPVTLCAGVWVTAGACSVPDAAMSSAEELQPGWAVCRSERGSWEKPMRWLEVTVEGLVPFGVVTVCHGIALLVARWRPGRPLARFQRIVAATLSAYVLLHLPFQVAQLLQLVDPDGHGHLLYLLGLAFNISSCVNPWLYLLLGTHAGHRLARLPRAVLTCLSPAAVTPEIHTATTSETHTATTSVSPAAVTPETHTATTTISSAPPAATTSVPPAAVTPETLSATTSGPPTIRSVPPAAITPVPL